MTSTASRVFTGEIRDRPGQRFVVVARDDLDAGRFVTAALGEPARLEEAGAEGLVVALPREGAGEAAVIAPLGLAPEAMSPGAW